MAAYRRVYDSRHLQADCQEAAPEPYARQSSMGYFFARSRVLFAQKWRKLMVCRCWGLVTRLGLDAEVGV